MIRIADKSEGGWRTVDEYLSDEIASDSEDEKRIRAADNRAVKKMKKDKKDTEKQTEKDQRRQQDHLHKLRMAVGTRLITMPCSPFEQRESVLHTHFPPYSFPPPRNK